MRAFFLFIFVISFALCGRGQDPPPAKTDTLLPGQNEHPDKPKFIPETDQRFFFFKNPVTGERARTNIWGGRAGFLFPSNIKIGAGFYFTNQRAGGQWGEYQLQNRRLVYGTLYVEPFFFRRKHWEWSTLLEAGFGTARYDLMRNNDGAPDIRRTWAVPLGIATSFSVKFPTIGRFRATRWLGINAMTGYRLTVQERIPSYPSTYNGFYYSVNPVIFLDRFYEDYSAWRKRKR
ncbi:MAG: hypothetical protein EAZ91_05550 [Cytophagales bacterium]|nr:MAG: hypothetical protein EAZ91_05550 [Cytophagales bacterium]